MPEPRFIAPQSSRAYGLGMFPALMRIAAFVAFLAMPLGMAAAPAAGHDGSAATAAADHCGEKQGTPEAPSQQPAHCAVCAALPAAADPVVESLLPKVPLSAALIAPFEGIELEIATPPPKNG